MSPLSALFQRHRERLDAAAPLLWVNPPRDLQDELLPGGEPRVAAGRCFTQDESIRCAMVQRGVNTEFGAFPPSEPRWQAAALALPREKALTGCLAHALAAGASRDAVLYAAGELRAGARSAAGRLENHWTHVRKIDSARHCVMYECRGPTAAPFYATDYQQRWLLTEAGLDLEIRSYPGVFSHGRLDEGTALLLNHLEPILADRPSRALDLGCGAGVIGAALLRARPELRLVCSDTSALALAATRATLSANGLEATLVASDGMNGVPGRFDLVISNPPFHAGHRQRPDLGARVFENVRNFLTDRGQLVMVVNRHLPWRRWLDQTFGRHDVLAADNRYHVLRARGSAAAT